MKTYGVSDIARYFLAKSDADDGDLISNLKLQKLCYYAQGVGLIARGGAPLFNERIEAWLHGPVVPILYNEYRHYGRSAIAPVSDLDLSKYDAEDLMILDDVFDYYGQYSAWRLREMTHTEAPWKDAYAEAENTVITPSVLANFFKDQVSTDYSQTYEQVSRKPSKTS
jgi:uncharacterized phage-associated protein